MDESHSIATIFVMVLLLIMSAFFSATETAFSSLNKNKLKVLKSQGNRRAKGALKLFDDYDALLSTVLIGNNIVNIALASISTMFFINISGKYGSTISTIIITIVVLIFGEVTPKSLAKEHAESFAITVTPFVSLLKKLFKPLNFLFAKWKSFISKVFNTHKNQDPITDEELLSMLDEATDLGGIDVNDGDLIRNAIEFSDLKASDILIPRTQIKAVQKNDSIEDITNLFLETEYSRVPVYDENLDDIIGILHYKDFMSHVRIEGKTLASYVQPAIFVAPSMGLHDLLQMLQKQKKHIVVVTDEYGGTMGIATMEDILEELVGEILDETDEQNELITKLDDNTYLINTFAELDNVFESLNICDVTEANTVGGWINEKLNAIPQIGDTFETDQLEVLVTEADKNRASEIKLTLK